MNQPWTPPSWPPQVCTCGCDPCRCEDLPDWQKNLMECWENISRFKRLIEQILKDMGVTVGPQGPAGVPGPAGPQGPVGQQGQPGPAGLDLAYVGATAPPNAQNGELWFNTSNNNLYVYDAGNWVDVTGSIPVPGPAGPAGAQGPAGPAGPQGAQGPAGPAGPQGAAGIGSITPGGIGSISSVIYQLAAGQIIDGATYGLTPGQWLSGGGITYQVNVTGATAGFTVVQRIA